MRIVTIESKRVGRKASVKVSKIEEFICSDAFFDVALRLPVNKFGKVAVPGATVALELDAIADLDYDHEIGAVLRKLNTIFAAMAMADNRLSFYARGTGSKKKGIPMLINVFRPREIANLFDYSLDENIAQKRKKDGSIIKNAYEQPSPEEIARVKAFVESYFAETEEEVEETDSEVMSE